MRRRLREAISALRLFASSAPLMIVTPWDDSCGDCSQASADRAGLGYAPRMNRLLPLIFARSEEHTSELQSLMRISYAVFCLKTKNIILIITTTTHIPIYNINTRKYHKSRP